MSFLNTWVQNVEGSSEWTSWTSGFHILARRTGITFVSTEVSGILWLVHWRRTIKTVLLNHQQEDSVSVSSSPALISRIAFGRKNHDVLYGWTDGVPKTVLFLIQPQWPLVAMANQMKSIKGHIYKLIGGMGVIHRRKVEGEGTHLVPRRLLQQTWKLQR